MTAPLAGTLHVVDGRRVHALSVGEGPPVLLLHGCGSLGQEMLAAFRPALRDTSLVAIDRPGYGYSDALPDGATGPRGQARHLAAFLEQAALRRPLVIAHSLGSGAALWLAATRPDLVSGLVLLAPFCRPTSHAALPLLRLAASARFARPLRSRILPAVAPLLGPGRMAAALRPNRVPAYLSDFPYVHAVHAGAVLAMASELLAFNPDMADLPQAGPRPDLPALVVYGVADRIAPPHWHVPWVLSVLGSAGCIGLPGIGHAPHHGDRHGVVALIRTMVRECG